jgi:hypothetical protein
MSADAVLRRGRGKAAKTVALIEAAHAILAEIQPATVRAVCYRLFTLGLIPNMGKSATNAVSRQLTWAREQQIIPWSWIVDETRAPERVAAWENPEQYIDVVQRSYRRDRWTDQPAWIEVWSEKGTIRGMLAPVLDAYGVTFRVMHGYGSATAIHQAADEIAGRLQVLTMFYVGDWDPSGLHMSAVDLPARMAEYGGAIEMIRLALTAQDTTPRLPSFSVETKCHDTRYRWFVEHYGTRCWELDALNPIVLRDRVEAAIRERIDWQAWERADVVERAERESLTTILQAWPGISRQATKNRAPT